MASESENIIKSLGKKALEGLSAENEEGEDDASEEGGKIKNKMKSKKRERSIRIAGTTARTGRDIVMTKLASIIEPMKEAFFVVKLHPEEFARAAWDLRLKELSQENGETESTKKRMRPSEIAMMSRVENKADLTRMPSASSVHASAVEKQAAVEPPQSGNIESVPNSAEVKGPSVVADADPGAMVVDNNVTTYAESKGADDVSVAVSQQTSAPGAIAVRINDAAPEVKLLLPNGKFERVPEETEEAETAVSGGLPVKTESIGDIVVIDTEDVDDTQECEHFETRQAFLNLCQGNHYQFDQLRRAKHTSLMVLYHLHNPDAPKFVPQCTACNDHILNGWRYHCETCDLDFCQRCYSMNGSKIHQAHSLRPVSVGGNAQQTQLTAEQLRERQLSIQLHLAVLQHSAACQLADCKTKNCPRMKVIYIFLFRDIIAHIKAYS